MRSESVGDAIDRHCIHIVIISALAYRVFHTYTKSVKIQKLIHLLLVIALFYGQLVANVHVVGHVHADDCELQRFSQTADCDISQQIGAYLADAAQHHKGEPLNDHSAENDCSIYHALSGLNGLFSVSQKEPGSLTRHTVINQSAGFYLPATVRNAQPIRAPPAIV